MHNQKTNDDWINNFHIIHVIHYLQLVQGAAPFNCYAFKK